MSHNERDIRMFLDQWAKAEANGDGAVLTSLLTDDFLGVGPMGFVLPKQAWIDRHGSGGLKYDSFELSEMQIREHGDVVLVTARLDQPGSHQGNPIPVAARATLIVVNQLQETRLAGISLTFLAGTRGAPPSPGQR